MQTNILYVCRYGCVKLLKLNFYWMPDDRPTVPHNAMQERGTVQSTYVHVHVPKQHLFRYLL